MAKLMSKGTLIEFSDDDFVTTHSLTCQLASYTGPATTTNTIASPDLCPDTQTEKVPGEVSVEDFTVDGYFDPADTAIKAAQGFGLDNTVLGWRVTYTDATPTTSTFDGFINALGVAGAGGDTIKLSMSVAAQNLVWADVIT